MKKVLLVFIAIFLMRAAGVRAQTGPGIIRPNLQGTIADMADKGPVKTYRDINLILPSKYKSIKRLSTIRVFSDGYGFDNSRPHSRQNSPSPLRTFTGSEYRLIPYNYTAAVGKNRVENAPVVNAGNFKAKENSNDSGPFGCEVDNASGVNIGLTKNSCLNLDFGMDTDSNSSNVVNLDNLSSDYATREADFSISLLFGLW